MISGRELEIEATLVGAPDASLVVAGHSHIMALAAALREGLGPTVPSAVAVSPGPKQRNYWDWVANKTKDVDVAVSWQGNQHVAKYLLEREPFSLVDPVLQRVVGFGRVIPVSFFSEQMGTLNANLQPTLELLACTARRVFLMGTPPPKSTEFVRAHLEQESFLLQKFADLGQDPGEVQLTPAPPMLALWRVLQMDLEAIAREAGCSFVPSPQEALNAVDGTLKAELSAADATHANAAYGAMVWTVLEREVSDLGRGSRASI